MSVFSFIKHGYQLRKIEVEVSLVPGLPKIQFLGLADSAIKESELRIKSALKHQGFEFPVNQQVVVNLKPAHLKKSSRGLDLAVAAALLWKTEQIPKPLSFTDEGFDEKTEDNEIQTHRKTNLNSGVYVYGELGLDGSVNVPSDLKALNQFKFEDVIYTGMPKEPYEFSTLSVENLRDLIAPKTIKGFQKKIQFKRPELNEDIKFNQKAAETMMISAVGEHPILLAGPAGSGKTTFAENLFRVLKNPTENKFLESLYIHDIMGMEPLTWRPYVSPHHTITPLAMVGGGDPIFPGEITKAHGGVLMLDEFLEFSTAAKEALREPFEKGVITINRKGKTEQFPAQFFLIGTTNLCPCGDLVPGKISACRYSLTRCRSYIERLSGPVLDRFQILTYSHDWQGGEELSLLEIFKKIQCAQEFTKKRGQMCLNSKLKESDIEKNIDPFTLKNLIPNMGSSRRRKASLLKVARTVADLEESKSIQPFHIEKAAEYCLYPFESMKRIFA